MVGKVRARRLARMSLSSRSPHRFPTRTISTGSLTNTRITPNITALSGLSTLPSIWPSISVTGRVPTSYPIRVSKNGGNPEYGRIFHINNDEGWYRVENKWFVERSHFVVDETETEYLVLGYGEDDEPDADTDYSVYLEDRTNQDFHELVSFTYDGDPAERNLLDEEFRE